MKARKPLSEMVQYVKYPESSRHAWRPTPSTPYIYISFSEAQFLKTYSDRLWAVRNYQPVLDDMGSAPFIPAIRDELERLIRHEWSKTNIQLQFIPEDLPPEEVKKKNVVFIFSGVLSTFDLCEKSGTVNVATMGLYEKSPDDPSKIYVVSKIIRMPFVFRSTQINNLYKYFLMHELLHAITEGKHPIQKQDTDVGPFDKSLGCDTTLLTYLEDCKTITETTDRLNKEMITRFPCERFVKIADDFDPSLKPLDIELANTFNREYQARGQTSMSFLATASNEILQMVINFARSVVEDCPSYFPPSNSTAHLNYWNNNSLLFTPTTNVEQATTPALADGGPRLTLK